METNVNKQKGQRTYSAASLADIADFFEAQAQKEEVLMSHSGTQRDRQLHRGQAYTYRDCAGTLRDMWFRNGPLARMVKERLDSEEREDFLDKLSEVLSMTDIDGLQERLP